MTAVLDSAYSEDQIKAWLRGLLTIAWADGSFDEQEKALIHEMTDSELAPRLTFETFDPIEPTALAAILEPNSEAAENFLRMGVMVAIADGLYSTAEDSVLVAFCQALQLDTLILESLRSTLYNLEELSATSPTVTSPAAPSLTPAVKASPIDPLKPARDWLDQLSVADPRLARFVCKLVPSQCPFERDVTLFGKKLVHIPPMCKINPLYEQLVGLRFRALSYLADDCGEDVSAFI